MWQLFYETSVCFTVFGQTFVNEIEFDLLENECTDETHFHTYMNGIQIASYADALWTHHVGREGRLHDEPKERLRRRLASILTEARRCNTEIAYSLPVLKVCTQCVYRRGGGYISPLPGLKVLKNK